MVEKVIVLSYIDEANCALARVRRQCAMAAVGAPFFRPLLALFSIGSSVVSFAPSPGPKPPPWNHEAINARDENRVVVVPLGTTYAKKFCRGFVEHGLGANSKVTQTPRPANVKFNLWGLSVFCCH